MSSSTREIEAEIRKAVEVQGEKELKIKLREFADDVTDYARSIAPVDQGEFHNSIKNRARNRKGRLPARQIYSNDPKAHLLEGGTEDTPEFATFARTAFRYGGTPDTGGDE